MHECCSHGCEKLGPENTIVNLCEKKTKHQSKVIPRIPGHVTLGGLIILLPLVNILQEGHQVVRKCVMWCSLHIDHNVTRQEESPYLYFYSRLYMLFLK